MRNERDRDILGPGASVNDRVVRSGALSPLLPKDFKTQHQGDAIRLVITDGPKDPKRSGTVGYVCGWATGVDITTQAGRDAGAARATFFPLLSSNGVEDQQLTLYLADPQYLSGTFFCFAVNRDAVRSDAYLWAQNAPSEITDSTIPDNVTHVQVSGSGEYIGSDVVEAVSVSCRAPLPIGSFDGVQLYLKDYVNLGTMQEGEFHRHNGQPGGSLQFKVNYQVAKRIGTGTITLTNGSNACTGSGFITQAQAGDKVECGGARATILSVNSDTSITLTANWVGKSVAGSSDYAFFAKVRVYAVSLSKGGTRRSDVTNSPFADVVFDGSLGTPNGPATIYVSGVASPSMGNVLRIEWDNVLGTALKEFRVYRSPNSLDTPMLSAPPVPGANTKLIDTVPYNKALTVAGATQARYQTEDSNFSAYEREQGASFLYYVTTVNERGDESAASYSAGTCRLDSPDDTENGGRVGLKNLFYNAMLGGTAAGNVDETSTAQDTGMFTFVDGGYTPGVPGQPYGSIAGNLDGTNRYKGYTRWAGTKDAAAPTLPTFVNGNEIKMPAPGNPKNLFVFQEIGAWDELLGGGRGARFAKMKKNGFVVFQVKVRYDAGSMPNGSVVLRIEQYNNGVLTGNAKRQYRDTSSNLVFATGTSSDFAIAASLLPTDGSFQVFWAVYQFDAALGTTKQIRFTIIHINTSNGNPFYICEPMVNDGTDRGAWTADMADPYISLPAPGHPPGEPPRDGGRPWDRFA